MLVYDMSWSSEVQGRVRADHNLRLVLGVEPFGELFLKIGRWLLRFNDIIIDLWQLWLSPRTLLLLFFLTTIDILTIVDPM
jgi:hypothetical protein